MWESGDEYVYLNCHTGRNTILYLNFVVPQEQDAFFETKNMESECNTRQSLIGKVYTTKLLIQAVPPSLLSLATYTYTV